MAVCLVTDSAGVVSVSQADPCTTLVALTPAEYAAMASSPFQLSTEDGAQLGGAILIVWAIAWAFRTLARVPALDPEGDHKD